MAGWAAVTSTILAMSATGMSATAEAGWMPARGDQEADDSGTSQTGATVGAWVATARGGGVRPPPGVTCDSWHRSLGANTALVTYVDGRRVTWFMHDRTCGDRVQYVWIPDLQVRDLAAAAYDSVVSRAPDPRLVISPPADHLLVNLPVWFGAQPLATRSATASIPGRSVTVTLVPAGLQLDTGSAAAADQRVVDCGLWGSAERAANGCSWTPLFPSVPRTTGTDDYRYHGQLTLRWEATWAASNGTSGLFAPIATVIDVEFAVREVQTI